MQSIMPDPSSGHKAFLSHKYMYVLFGSTDKEDKERTFFHSNQLKFLKNYYKINLENPVFWEKIKVKKSEEILERSFFSLSYDKNIKKGYIFGGTSIKNNLNDFFSFNLIENLDFIDNLLKIKKNHNFVDILIY
jgi:hypothetical protein